MATEPAGRDGHTTADGGYDVGYRSCSCFWGRSPGSLIKWLHAHVDLQGARVLDLGCGEGKNAAWLADRGCTVVAIDISLAALSNAKSAWPEHDISWVCQNVLDFEFPEDGFDVVVAYGLMHCLTVEQIDLMINSIKRTTIPGGFSILVAFNDRKQDLSGHPDFAPTLLPHDYYIGRFSEWEVLIGTDEDLYEAHPHNHIPHMHSLTRIIAKAPAHE